MNRFKIFFAVCVLAVFFVSSISVFAQSEAARELNRKGLLAIDSGHHQEAILHLKQAMQLEPAWAEPYFNAAKLLKLRNKRDEMVKMLKKAQGLEPENTNYAEAYAKVLKESLPALEKSKDTTALEQILNEIVQVNPSEIGIGLKIIDRLIAANHQEKALAMGEKLIAQNPSLRTRYDSEEMGQLFSTMATIELQKNNLNTARIHADNASKYSLKNPDSIKQLLNTIKEKQSQAVQELIKQAQAEKEAGNNEAAIEILKRAEELSPGNESAQAALDNLTQSRDAKQSMTEAQKMVKNGSWLEARDMLEYVVSVEPENAEAQKLLEEASKKEDSLLKLLGRPDRLPRDQEGRSALIEGFLRRGKQFNEAGNEKDAATCFNRGMAIIELDKAQNRFRQQFESEIAKIKTSDDHATLWKKALDARNAYEYEDSLKHLSQLPKNFDVQLPSYLAEAYWKTGNEDKALEEARYQLTIQKENNRAKFVIASILLKKDEKDMAFKYFKEIYDSDPDYPEINDKLLASSTAKWKKIFPVIVLALLLWIAYALYKYLPEYSKNSSIRKAQTFLKKEMLEECIEELMKIRRLPNLTYFDGALISRILGQAYLKRGIYDKAIGECKHLISINPKDEDAHLWLGYAYLGRRMLSPESLPELLSLYQKDPRNIALVSLLGSHYTQQKTLSEDGVKILEQWLNLDPNNPDVLKPLGRYYLKKLRSDDKAMKVFQKMMELGSPEAEFLLGVARIHLKLRQFDSCLQLCEQVINSDVNNELVHSVLREAYHKQQRLNDLLEIYANFLKNNPYNVAFQNGLKETQKLVLNEENRRGPSASQPDEQQSASGQAVCPHCNQLNSSKDYCCQYCGKNLC